VSLRLSQEHELSNLCLRDIAQLSQEAEQALHRMRRGPALVAHLVAAVGIVLVSRYSGILSSS